MSRAADGTAAARATALQTRFGGKAAALIAAREAGLAVPPLFVLDANDMKALAQDTDRAAILHRVEVEYSRMGGGSVAVRSSAQAEDGQRSFAGQFESRLGVEGVDAILAAATDVAASARSVRVAAYGAATETDAGELAVLVQRMVPARHAGVAFSRDPVTFQPEVVVEAVAGQADRLLAGEQTPTLVAFGRGALDVLFTEERQPVPVEITRAAAELALECERLFGEPVDIEWAHDGERLWLLQTRRLTGFDAPDVYSDTWSSEVWPGLIRPLVFDVGDIAVNAAWGRLLTSLAGPVDVDWRQMAACIASRAYFNETLLGGVLAHAGLPENTLEVIGRGDRPRLREGSLWRLASSAGRLTRFLAGNVRWLAFVERTLPDLIARTNEAAAELEEAPPEVLAQRFEHMLDILEDAAYLSAVTTLSMQLRGAAVRLTAASLRRTSDDMRSVAQSAPLQALARVSEACRDLPPDELEAIETGDSELIEERLGATAEGRRALAVMHDVLGRWGHIATVNTDFSAPSWRDDPGSLWRLAAAARTDPGAAGRLVSSEPPHGVGARIVARRVRVLREFVAARDEVNDALARVYDALRRGTRLAGDFLVPSVLDAPDDVFFLRYEELLAALRGSAPRNLRSTVQSRRTAFDADAGIVPPHRVWNLRLPPRRRMLPDARRQPAGGDVLTGSPASAGTVTGRARVVSLSSTLPSLDRHDVLVVPHADVAWTPLFTVVGAVVTEAGGMLSHAAVVARELGIPAVVGVEDATRRIVDGTHITVDGSEGTVTVSPPRPHEPGTRHATDASHGHERED